MVSACEKASGHLTNVFLKSPSVRLQHSGDFSRDGKGQASQTYEIISTLRCEGKVVIHTLKWEVSTRGVDQKITRKATSDTELYQVTWLCLNECRKGRNIEDCLGKHKA